MFVVFAEYPSWMSASPNVSCESSIIEMWPDQRGSHSAFELVGGSVIFVVS